MYPERQTICVKCLPEGTFGRLPLPSSVLAFDSSSGFHPLSDRQNANQFRDRSHEPPPAEVDSLPLGYHMRTAPDSLVFQELCWPQFHKFWSENQTGNVSEERRLLKNAVVMIIIGEA